MSRRLGTPRGWLGWHPDRFVGVLSRCVAQIERLGQGSPGPSAWRHPPDRRGPRLSDWVARLLGARGAVAAVRQDENEVTVNGQGDSEEGRPCTKPAIEDAQLLRFLSKQAGPEPRESLKPSRTTPYQERQGQSNNDTTEEPTSVVQISSPSGASNGSPAMLKRDESGEDTSMHGQHQEGERAHRERGARV